MASGTIEGTTSKNSAKYRFWISWSSSSSTASNSSQVTATVYAQSKGYHNTTSPQKHTQTITINGSSHSVSKVVDLTGDGAVALVSATVTVPHSSDGTKSITISANCSMGTGSYAPGIGTASAAAKLDSIPRLSTITSGINFNAGNSLTVTISRASSSFTHVVEILAKNSSGEYADRIKWQWGIGTSWTFQFSEEDVANMASHASAGVCPIMVRCRTYLSSDQSTGHLGNTDRYGSIYLTPSAVQGNLKLTIGQPLALKLTRQSTGYTHTVTLKAGSFSRSASNVEDSTTFSFTQAEINSLYAQVPNSNTGSFTVTVATYWKSVAIATKNFTGTLTVNPTAAAPVFTQFTFAETKYTSLTGSASKIIKGYSSVTVSIPAAQKAKSTTGATIKRYQLQCGSQVLECDEQSGTVSGAFTKVQTNQFSVTAVDSRGNQTKVTKSGTLLDYTKPVIRSVNLRRTNGIAQTVTLDFSGSIWAKSFGSSTNAVKSVTYRWRESSGTTWTAGTTALEKKTTLSTGIIGNTTTGFTADKSYVVEVTLKDSIDSAVLTGEIPSGKPVMDFYRKGTQVGVGIGKQWSKGVLDVSGTICCNDLQMSDGSHPAIVKYLADKSDLNTLKTRGDYCIGADGMTISHRPTTETGSAFIEVRNGGNAGQLIQRFIYTSKTKPRVWQRVFYENAWGAWQLVGAIHTTLTPSLINGWKMISEGNLNISKAGDIVCLNMSIQNPSASVQVPYIIPEGYRPLGTINLSNSDGSNLGWIRYWSGEIMLYSTIPANKSIFINICYVARR